MHARFGLGEPVHLLPPSDSKLENHSVSSYEPDAHVNVFRRGAEKYAFLAALILACIGMTAWLGFLVLAVHRAIEWSVG